MDVATYICAVKIEEEIQQGEFASSYQKVTVNILFTSSWLGGLHLQFLKPYNISMQQFNVLRILRGQFPNPASITLLTERMLDKNSNASRLVDKLLDKELIERKVCLNDRRQKDVVISEQGLELLERIDSEFVQFEQRLAQLSPEEAEQLSDLLDKLRG